MTGPSAFSREEFAAVMTAARADAPWAYTRLFESLSGPVRGYVAARGAEDPDAVTSEVFLGAFRNLASFEGDVDDFRSWIFTIAHRRLVDDLRRQRRRLPTTPLDVGRHDPGADDTTQVVLGRLEHSELAPALDALRPQERDVVLLRVVGGLDVAAVAKILGLREGHVRVLQHRALSALREAISEDA